MAKLRNDSMIDAFPLVSFSGSGIASTTLSKDSVILCTIRGRYTNCVNNNADLRNNTQPITNAYTLTVLNDT